MASNWSEVRKLGRKRMRTNFDPSTVVMVIIYVALVLASLLFSAGVLYGAVRVVKWAWQ